MNDVMDLMRARHSVRQYLDRPIPGDVRAALDACARALNVEGGLNMQLIYDEPECFSSRMARYGRFENAKNYIAMVGRKAPDLEERCGFYGEKLVLKAQELGLNTCWVAMTFNKKKVRALLSEGDSLCMVIALGFGETQGNPRKSRSIEDVTESRETMPAWFIQGVEAALKAPTAINQQKFQFALQDGVPTIRVMGIGSNTKVDLGIAACHFEAATGQRVTHRA